MYKFRKFLKYLGYSLVYILVSVASAYGVITLSVNNSSKKGGHSSLDAETPLPAQISSIVENFATATALDVNLTADINSNADRYVINLDAVVDLSQGVDNVKAEGTLSATIGSAQPDDNVSTLSTQASSPLSLSVDFSYQNNFVYLDMFNGKMVLETNSLMGTLNEVLSLMNVDLESMGLADMLNMPINDMLSMLSNIKDEQKNEETDKISLVVALPMVGDATLLCDASYKLEGIVSDMAISDGLSVGLDSQIAYPEESGILDKSEEDYVNVGNLLTIAKPLINFTEQNEFALDLNVDQKPEGQERINLADGELYLDVVNKKAMLRAEAFGTSANLIFIDKSIYLEYQNIYSKFNLDDIEQVANLLENSFNLSLPQEAIDTILALLNGEEIELPTGDLISGFNPETLDLSILEKVEVIENSTIISLKDLGTIRVTTENESISELAYSGFGYVGVAKVIPYNSFDLASAEENYIDLATFIPTIENATQIIGCDTISGSATVKLEDFELPITFVYNKQNDYALVSTNVYGIDVNIDYLNKKAYVNVADKFKLVADSTTIADEILALLSEIGVDTNVSEAGKLVDKAAALLDPSSTPLFITGLEETENGFILSLFNDTDIVLTNSEKQIALSTQLGSIEVSAIVMGGNESVSLPTINE
ncbi:MAG: hypothetical protein J6K97_00605, partial [Clostridia bacterium]|nr:hypothetical protein [Clostridia bacterium]